MMSDSDPMENAPKNASASTISPSMTLAKNRGSSWPECV
jgi:hypothetical protein